MQVMPVCCCGVPVVTQCLAGVQTSSASLSLLERTSVLLLNHHTAPSVYCSSLSTLMYCPSNAHFISPCAADRGHPDVCLLHVVGAFSNRWLDWDREYRAWKGAGLPVSVSYQFLARDQPPSAWADPYGISYTLGFKFARHFGPTSGTGNVVSFEAGNEPCEPGVLNSGGH
jgi:hypothetical protein